MTRTLHLITGRDGAGLPLDAATDLAALPGEAGLQLAATAWMIPAPLLLGHEDLRLREGAETRLAVMAEVLLRDHGGRSQPALLTPALEAASLTAGNDMLLSWAETLDILQAAFRRAGTDVQLQIWHLQVPGALEAEASGDLAAALVAQGFATAPRGVLQPAPDSDLARHLRAAALVNDLTTRMAAQAGGMGLQLASPAPLRAYAARQLAQLASAGLVPDTGHAAALDQLAGAWLRALTGSLAPFESVATK